MGLDGPGANRQPHPNLFARHPVHQKRQDLALAGGQQRPAAGLGTGLAEHVGHVLLNGDAVERTMMRDRVDGRHQVLDRRVFQQIAVRALLHRPHHIPAAGVHRQQQHLQQRLFALDRSEHLEPVRARHRQVEHEHIGRRVAARRDG